MLAKYILIALLNSNPMEIDIDSIDLEEAFCLSLNIYHEARSEKVPGQVAVATTTMNRVESGWYPDTVCEVVMQPAQFSWVDDEHPNAAYEDDAFRQSAKIALMVMSGAIVDNTGGATHYHNYKVVTPHWAQAYLQTVTYGLHRFYKPKGRTI